MMPVIILGGIYGGIFTPTEAAAVAALYGLLVGFFIYKTLKLQDLMTILKDSVSQTAVVMFIVGTASLFSWVLTVTGVASAASNTLITMVGGNKILFLLVLNMAIGLVTPPVGINLYTGCGIANISLKEISKAVLPFVFASLLVLILVTYVPAVSTWLPSLISN